MEEIMKRRKPIAFILSVLMAFSVASFVACNNNDDPFVEKLDPTKTQIYVYNYYAGFRADWLLSAKKQFEEMYKDYPGVDGKVGVQILMDNRKQEFSDAASTVRNGTNEVYFTEGTSFHGLYNGDGLYDMTEWMTEPLTEFGETRSIADKMTAEQREYMGVEIDGEERYFSLPNYSGFSGIVYNKDIFESKGFYYKKGHESVSSIYDKFTGDLTDLSSGPDGKYGTYDDGMPATYEEFYTLCDFIKSSGVVPFIWTGVHYKAYFGKLMMSLVADYEGPEETRLNFSLGGTSHTLINADGTSYKNSKEQGFPINESNAYELARQEGRLKATEFIKKILDTAEWQSSNAYEGVVSHTDAQALYLSSGMDGNRQIAMLIDGSWWEGEASDAFNDTAIRYKAGNKYERNFGFLPLPKADKTKMGQRTILDDLGSMVFVKATLAPDFFGEIDRIVLCPALQHRFKQHALGAVGDVLLRRNDLYAVLFENILVVGGVVAIAGEAVELPNEHGIEQPAIAVFDHALKVGAVVRLGRERTIDVCTEHGNAVAFGKFHTLSDLPLDAFLSLIVGAITRVNNCFHKLLQIFHHHV